MMKKNNKNKIVRRIVSIIMAVSIILDATPLNFAYGVFERIFTGAGSHSASIVYAYDPSVGTTAFAGNTQDFTTVKLFEDFCYYYSADEGFATAHQYDTLKLSMSLNTQGVDRDILTENYVGLGTQGKPFGGIFQLPATDIMTSYPLTNNSSYPLFNYVYDSVSIQKITYNTSLTISLKSTVDVATGESKPSFAQHVVHDNRTDAENSTVNLANWSIELAADNSGTYSGIIGEIGSGATVNLTLANKSSAAINIVSNAPDGDAYYVDDVGAICGIMQTGSTLNLTFSEEQSGYEITSAYGNAGGLVGTMNGNARMNITSIPASSALKSIDSKAGYAGGLVGEITSEATISMASAIPVGGGVTGTNGAGGLFGYYGNVTTNNAFDVKAYNNTASVYGQYCGGLFGVLENKMVSSSANTLTITDTTSSGHATMTITSGSGDTYDETGYFGGLVGRYITDSLANGLELVGLEYSVTAADSFNAFGGAVGMIDAAAYVKADDITITAGGTDKRSSVSATLNEYTYFGGLIGSTSASNGDFIDLGDFTLTLALTDADGFNGGGVVGRFYKGVLRLSGTTDMSGAKPAGIFATTNANDLRYSYYGQIIGYNDNVLTYALGDGANGSAYGNGWTFKRSSGAISDDLGTWGEVVRVFKVSETDKNAEGAGILTLDSTNHTVRVAAAQTDIGNTVSFAKTALNIQLNQGTGYDCLLFTSGEANERETLLGSTFALSSNIDLSGTGITGFMRDGCYDISVGDKDLASIVSSKTLTGVGTFVGTLNGGSKTVTLAIGEKYGYDVSSSSNAEGIGQIYRHRYNGLFSLMGDGTTGTGTINSITVAGTINVRNAGPDGMCIGGIAARSHGSATFDGVTVSGLTINYHEGNASPCSEDLGKNIGGFIGYVDNHGTDNGTIEIKGVSVASPNIMLTGHHESWNVYGGVIGKVDSAKIIINIGQNSGDKLTVGMAANISGVTNVGSNSDSGGLIGYFVSKGSYATRTVNINNLEFNNCTVGNAASTTGGGFLGYAWLNTTTTIDGLTVKGTSSINNVAGDNVATTPNVGVMCYCATGKWIVNSLTVTAMSMTTGGGTSIGMIVNNAYSGDNGLYLDVLNSGYTLTESGISLPTPTTYDEIAAKSANNVIDGGKGAGVVSIDMNASRTGTATEITVTGTYQNKLSGKSAKFANSSARYYYNINHMSSSDGGQNLVLWSLSKYAASNISNEFVSGKGTDTSFGTTLNTTLSGTANLTGLSFYPIKNADNYSIEDITLTFDYGGVYSTAEATFGTANADDSYNRDPGAANQHFLMHSGLFVNIPKGKTVTITGKLKLAGTFLELAGSNGAVDGYSGVLVSKIMNGNFKCETGSIELAGITPKTTANAANVSGYLLINNITRESDTDAAPQLIIRNLYTGSGYPSTTVAIASSLIGAATGNDLTIKFSHVKLDARTAAISNATANTNLTTAYGTSRSIFNDAVFMHSIKTNQTAVLEYYYTYAEDWEDGDDADSAADRFVTYGKEVVDSVEYREETTLSGTTTYVSLENMYSGAKRWYTNPESNTSLGDQYGNFSSGWLKYVAEPYSASSDTETYYRELKVNVEKSGPLTGCGTYNHPYEISGNDLMVVAKFISSGSPSDMQKIRLPKTQIDGVANNAKGNRWCADLEGCAEFEASGSNYVYSYLDKTETTSSSSVAATEGDVDSETVSYLLNTSNKTVTYTKTTISVSEGTKTTTAETVVYKYENLTVGESVSVDGGVDADDETWTISEDEGIITKVVLSAANDTSTTTTYTLKRDTYTWTAANVRLYLTSAYYKVTGNIDLGTSFVGLGCSTSSATGDYAFRGVIVGEQTSASNSAPKWTITNNSVNPLIKVSNGSVVKDLNIIVDAGTITLSQTTRDYNSANFGYNSQCQYYGGIIGEIMGGDNIIDNSYVKYSYKDGNNVNHVTKIQLTDDNDKNKYGTIIPVGGYVGVVVFGGLVFKNMTATNTTIGFSGLDVAYACQQGNYTVKFSNNPTDGDTFTVAGTTITVVSGDTKTPAGIATKLYNAIGNNENYDVTDNKKGTLTFKEKKGKYGIGAPNVSTTSANTTLTVNVTKNPVSGNLADNSKEEAWAAIYVNPIVGRVINGYAVNETTKFSISENGKYHDDAGTDRFDATDDDNADLLHTLKNGTKHYTIADIKKGEENKLSFGISTTANNVTTVTNIVPNNASTDGTINIPNSQAFFILSLITQSCSGTAQTSNGGYVMSLSYGTNTTVYGMSHIADYSDVGKENITTSNTDYSYASNDTAANTAIPYIIRWYTAADSSGNYPARCVTSTKGYYDINLIGKTVYSNSKDTQNNIIPLDSFDYQLPDSFRGLGSVGNYDNSTNNGGRDSKFCIKLDIFNGNGCAIDEDIYLNKYKYDNYFNVLHTGASQDVTNKADPSGTTNTNNHGIGLFDSVVMKGTGKISDFILSGSVRTAAFDNTYKSSSQECHEISGQMLWLSVGGVCGWSTNVSVNLSFEQISIDGLAVCGTNHIGGILGYSGLKSKAYWINIKQCSADNLSIRATAGTTVGDGRQARCGMGAFVGKVQEGAVYIYGTSSGESNTDLTKYLDVKLSDFSFALNNKSEELNYNMSAGGLVGFAGNGCRIYDMHLSSANSAITIGNNKTRFAGGMVGAMQSYVENERSGIAVFKNCIVENINVNGNFAGGYYGGKWDSGWTTFSLSFTNCKLIGSSGSHNTVFGNDSFGDATNNNANNIAFAGGFVGRLYPYSNKDESGKETYNVLIEDCVISNYDIISATTVTSYAGGFIGNADSKNDSVTCYMHDCSIENCKIGAAGNYAGGIIGKIVQHDANKLIGYNIKLDTILTDADSRMGAWIGYAPDDTSNKKTSIQFAGLAVYGTGYKNVGNDATLNTASFVFADYNGACNGTSTEVTIAASEGDTNSISESYSINEADKTITRTIVTVTISGSDKKTRTQTITYRYGSMVTGDPISVTEGIAVDSTTWSISESEGKIYKVVADATSNTKTMTTYAIAVSGYNDDDNVNMPKYPFVNINPQVKMGASNILTSDGAVLYGNSVPGYENTTGNQTMAAKIFYDLKQESSDADNYSRRYTTFDDSAITTGSDAVGMSIENYIKHVNGEDGDRISTYLTENGSLPSGVGNFAVVVIANTDNVETTNLINRYIQLVTNTSTDYTDYSDYYDIEVKTCKYNGSKFEITNDATGLSWTKPTATVKGSFALVGANADSGRSNTFTLVDVQFKDPLHTENIAYHLYVPVYTIKQMTFGFHTAVISGTDSVKYSLSGDVSSSPYASLLSTTGMHVDCLETWVTQYVRFTYAQEDINDLISAGNLNWNLSKSMIYDTMNGGNKLPNNSYLILTDPNGGRDKMYYALASSFTNYAGENSGWKVDFNDFTDGTNDFSPMPFKDILANSLTKTTVEGTGYYTTTGANSSNYDLVYNNEGTLEYYKYDSNGTSNVNFSVSSNVYEDYYVSMYVPKQGNNNTSLYMFSVTAPSLLSGTKTAKRDNADYTTYNVLIAELYSQTPVRYEVGNDDQHMTESNRLLYVDLATTITLTNQNAIMHLSGRNLYHSFLFNLNKYDAEGYSTSRIYDLSDDDITAYYGVADTYNTSSPPTPATLVSDENIDLQNDYLNINTTDIMTALLGSTTLIDGKYPSITVYAYVQMEFGASNLSDEFPPRGTGEDNIGVNIAGKSNLAYNTERLSYTSMTSPFDMDGHYYYIESVNTAKLNYFGVDELDSYDTDGVQSSNNSRLGVNGRSSSRPNSMPIDSKAFYNVGMLDNWREGEKIRLALTLSKKTDTVPDGVVVGADYVQVDKIADYLTFGTIVSGTSTFTMDTTNSTDSVYYFEGTTTGCMVSEDGVFTLEILFNVKTGSGFTEYANYQVNLKAELLDDEDNTLENSRVGDYLVYSNVKVYSEVINPNNVVGN